MLTPEQIAEYQTERKALAMLKRGLYPEKLADNEFVVRVWDVEGWFDGGYAGEGPTPALALAAAYDALEVEAEECPVMATYKEALRPFGELHIGSNWPDAACIAKDQDGEQITAGDIRKAASLSMKE